MDQKIIYAIPYRNWKGIFVKEFILYGKEVHLYSLDREEWNFIQNWLSGNQLVHSFILYMVSWKMFHLLQCFSKKFLLGSVLLLTGSCFEPVQEIMQLLLQYKKDITLKVCPEKIYCDSMILWNTVTKVKLTHDLLNYL